MKAQSGTFELPTLLKYPEISPIAECPQIIGQFCYVIEDYKPGLAVLIKRNEDLDGIVVGDWESNRIGMESKSWNLAKKCLSDYTTRLIKLMQHIQLQQAEFYFSSNDELVDVQLSLDRFIGPGMIRDMFSKVIPTCKILEISVASADKVKQLQNCVLKPSKFKTYEKNGVVIPLYARI